MIYNPSKMTIIVAELDSIIQAEELIINSLHIDFLQLRIFSSDTMDYYKLQHKHFGKKLR